MTETIYSILLRISNASSAEIRIAQRAKVILLAWDRLSNTEISHLVGLERHSVGRWRRRWQESYAALLSIQLNEPCAVLVRAVEDVLRDAHRSGAPWKFTAQQVVELVSIACEDPRLSGPPVNNWTGRELADEMQKRNTVEVADNDYCICATDAGENRCPACPWSSSDFQRGNAT